MMGSYSHYTMQQIRKAEALNAPDNTIYFNGDTPVTFDTCTNPDVIHYFKVRGLQ